MEENHDSRNFSGEQKIQLLDSAIGRSVMVKPLVVYCGLGREEAARLRNCKPGDIYMPRQFVSTSRSIDIAYAYCRGHGGIIIEAKTKAFARGIIFGDVHYEDEVALPRATQFKVLNIVYDVDKMGESIIRYICEANDGN